MASNKLLVNNEKTIEELIGDQRNGRTLLSPFAEVEFYPITYRVGATDIEAHKKHIINAFKKPATLKLSTRELINTNNYKTLIGVMESLTIDITTIVGGKLQLVINDVEAGQNLNRFLESINNNSKNGSGIYTTYAKVKFGWLTNLGYAIESKELVYLLNDIKADFDGGQFTYIMNGVEYAVPYYTTYPLWKGGNYSGTLKDVLDEWETRTGITITPESREIVDETQYVLTTNSVINPMNMTPYTLLEEILKSARVKSPNGDKYGAVTWHVHPVSVENPGNVEISLTAVTSAVKDVYKTYIIGQPTSTVLDGTSFHNNLATSRLGTKDVRNIVDLDNNKTSAYKKILDKNNPDDTTTSERLKPHPYLETPPNTDGPKQVDSNRVPNYDVVEGTIVTIGDPDLIPDRTMKVGSKTKSFYTSNSPFLGVEVKAYIQKPINMYELDYSGVYDKHYINGVYIVDRVSHVIDRQSYTTSLDVKKYYGVETLIQKK